MISKVAEVIRINHFCVFTLECVSDRLNTGQEWPTTRHAVGVCLATAPTALFNQFYRILASFSIRKMHKKEGQVLTSGEGKIMEDIDLLKRAIATAMEKCTDVELLDLVWKLLVT